MAAVARTPLLKGILVTKWAPNKFRTPGNLNWLGKLGNRAIDKAKSTYFMASLPALFSSAGSFAAHMHIQNVAPDLQMFNNLDTLTASLFLLPVMTAVAKNIVKGLKIEAAPAAVDKQAAPPAADSDTPTSNLNVPQQKPATPPPPPPPPKANTADKDAQIRALQAQLAAIQAEKEAKPAVTPSINEEQTQELELPEGDGTAAAIPTAVNQAAFDPKAAFDPTVDASFEGRPTVVMPKADDSRTTVVNTPKLELLKQALGEESDIAREIASLEIKGEFLDILALLENVPGVNDAVLAAAVDEVIGKI